MSLGPIPASDSRFMRRVRVHQAWYRTAVLGLTSYGVLAASGRPCGSVLTDDSARRDMNFIGEEAAVSYKERRKLGWGVDPIRCTSYLTSSQTLSFNMFALVVSRPAECAQLFNLLLGRSDLAYLETFRFEFAAQGTPYSLGDKTLIDLLLRIRTKDGGLQVIAIETKLADRFSTRRTSAAGGPKYLHVASVSRVWRNLASAVEDNRTRQLTRCHALAQSVQNLDGLKVDRLAVMVVLTHPQDSTGAGCTAEYSGHVMSQSSLVHRTWDQFLDCARTSAAMGAASADELDRRYVDLSLSESSWIELNRQDVSRSERTTRHVAQ